jgi:hypothetical protein
MPIIHYRAPIELLVAVRGHPFDRSAFDAIVNQRWIDFSRSSTTHAT